MDKRIHSFRRFVVRAFIGLMTVFPIGMLSSGSEPPDTDDVAMSSINVRGLDIVHDIMSVFVLPGESVLIHRRDSGIESIKFETSEGLVCSSDSNTQSWIWQAPDKPGLYPIYIHTELRTFTLQVFVIVPATEIRNGYLNGYPIGHYPKKPLKNLEAYNAPLGFIEVTRENENTLVSPHFRLKQFLCKDDAQYPKYVVLQEALLIKMESIFESLKAMGLAKKSLTVMSGFRTPAYNRSIGNVQYSQHVYGGAADIYIDESPKDDMMDDLNNDGVINFLDAQFLYNHIDHLSSTARYEILPGGLGAYEENEAHGPFVHIDVRGYQARWTYAGGGS